MKFLFFAWFVAFFLVFVLSLLFYCLGVGFKKDREKGSPYECGFDPVGETRVPFSLRFFLMGLIFMVFDLETVLILPMIYVSLSMASISGVVFFLLLLLLGLYHEWRQGSLEWV